MRLSPENNRGAILEASRRGDNLTFESSGNADAHRSILVQLITGTGRCLNARAGVQGDRTDFDLLSTGRQKQSRYAGRED